MEIPLADLRAQHDELRTEIDAAWHAVLDESAFIGGPRIAAFEDAFARFCGTGHAVALASGTDALELSLRALGVGHGDVVVSTPHTFLATIEGVVQLGATPRFVDVNPATYNLDPTGLARYLGDYCERDVRGVLRERESGLRVAAILPVHLYGLPADMTPILDLARDHGVAVVEDACQAHGAEYRGRDGEWTKVGALGNAGCFSFFPSKNLGAIGEAGAVVTDDRLLAERVRVLRDHGQSERYVHVSPDGVNARMDALQAAILTIKLRKLADWNDRRRQVAEWYAEELAETGLQLPYEPPETRHVYHIYAVRVPDRERIREHLSRHGISTGLHYPIPIHLQPAFAHLELGLGTYPEAERAAAEELSLPMYPHLSREQVAFVAARLREVVA